MEKSSTILANNAALNQASINASVVTIGGGPVGCVFALAMAQQGLPVTVLEAKPKAENYSEGRALALSYGTKIILERLGVWSHLSSAVPIEKIHISQKGSFGRSILRAAEHQLPALGYVVSYGALSQALDSVIAQTPTISMQFMAEVGQITPQADATLIEYMHNNQSLVIKTPLAVLADGGRGVDAISGIKRKEKAYGHDAIVCKVSAELPHANIAYERFTSMGPMALLPNGARDYTLVWTGPEATIKTILALDDAEFLRQLHAHFGDLVGRFTACAARLSFPLKLAQIEAHTLSHLAIIGNAAQTMHPVAGQGFNVGIRDAWELAQLIAKTDAATLGSAAMLATYRQSRHHDTQRGLQFTDVLVNLFSNDILGVSGLRAKGLGLFDLVTPAKRFLVDRMSYGGR